MLDCNERTEMHVLIKDRKPNSVGNRQVKVKRRIWSFGSDLGTNNKFLKLSFHKPRVNDGLHYKPQLKTQLVILPIVLTLFHI